MNRFNRIFTNNINYVSIRSFSRNSYKFTFRKNKNIIETNYIDVTNTNINTSFSSDKNIKPNETFKQNETKSSKYSNFTNSDLIDSNYGLREFVKKTYLWTGGGIFGSIGLSILGASVISANPHLLSNSIGTLFGTGCVLGLGGALGIGFTKYSIHKDIVKVYANGKKNQVEISYSINSIPRTLSYISLIVGNGIIMVPMFAIIPDAVLPAFIASSSVFGGASWYAMTRKTGELEIWGSALHGGLTGLVGVSLVGLGSNLIFGHNWFGDITHLASLYGGIPLFTGLVAYDTHKSIDKYQSGDPDHLGCSTELYLDFINLFVRFMEIIAKIQSANKNND